MPNQQFLKLGFKYNSRACRASADNFAPRLKFLCPRLNWIKLLRGKLKVTQLVKKSACLRVCVCVCQAGESECVCPKLVERECVGGECWWDVREKCDIRKRTREKNWWPPEDSSHFSARFLGRSWDENFTFPDFHFALQKKVFAKLGSFALIGHFGHFETNTLKSLAERSSREFVWIPLKVS